MTCRLILAFVLLAAVPPAPAADKPFEVRTEADLPYVEGKAADPEKQKLDLYVPKDAKGFPVLVFVHGGGYSKGDRKDGADLGKLLAAHGVGAAVISYRLFPQVKHPEHIRDVARAFAWTKANAAKYGGNPDAVFVGGHSAGAHLATLLAADESYLKAEKLGLKDIRGVVSLSGGYRIGEKRKDVFGSDEAMKAASPFAHLKAGHPPHLLVYAEKDAPDRDKLTNEFADALRAAKADATVTEAKGRDHATLFTKLAADDDTFQTVVAFIQKAAK